MSNKNENDGGTLNQEVLSSLVEYGSLLIKDGYLDFKSWAREVVQSLDEVEASFAHYLRSTYVILRDSEPDKKGFTPIADVYLTDIRDLLNAAPPEQQDPSTEHRPPNEESIEAHAEPSFRKYPAEVRILFDNLVDFRPALAKELHADGKLVSHMASLFASLKRREAYFEGAPYNLGPMSWNEAVLEYLKAGPQRLQSKAIGVRLKWEMWESVMGKQNGG